MVHRFRASRAHLDVTLSAATPLGSWITKGRCQQTFVFEAVQRRIECARGGLATRPFVNLIADRDPICVISEPKYCQQDDVFEFSEDRCVGHLNYMVA